MQTEVTAPMLRAWIVESAAVLRENRAYLTDLDSPIGDADHGNNMQRGFDAAEAALPETGDLDDILRAVAMALIGKVGGAAGPLYGTLFLEAGRALKGSHTVTGLAFVEALDNGLAALKKRGKSDVGMKTMIDALMPALDTLRGALLVGADLPAALAAAAEAAEAGMAATIPMLAQRGRASYLGERSIGHQDPGATSSALLMRALADVAAS